MISVYITFAIIALIFSAMIAGIIGDCKRYKTRMNALKQPKDNLTEWLNERDKIAFNALRKGD